MATRFARRAATGVGCALLFAVWGAHAAEPHPAPKPMPPKASVAGKPGPAGGGQSSRTGAAPAGPLHARHALPSLRSMARNDASRTSPQGASRRPRVGRDDGKRVRLRSTLPRGGCGAVAVHAGDGEDLRLDDRSLA